MWTVWKVCHGEQDPTPQFRRRVGRWAPELLPPAERPIAARAVGTLGYMVPGQRELDVTVEAPPHPGHFVTVEPGGPLLFVPGRA
jgi:hypothetical protein